jgi:hypothetical protein
LFKVYVRWDNGMMMRRRMRMISGNQSPLCECFHTHNRDLDEYKYKKAGMG